MNIPHGARVYAHGNFDQPLPIGVSPVVSLDGQTWVTMTVEAANQARVLVASPQAQDNPPDTVVLPEGASTLRVKIISGEEIIILDWEPFTVGQV